MARTDDHRSPWAWPGMGIDIAVAAILLLLAVFGTDAATVNQEMGPTPAAAVVLASVGAAATIGWRIAPVATFGVVGGLSLIYLGAGFAFGPMLVSLVVACFGLASRVPIRSVLRWSAWFAVVLVPAIIIRAHVVGVGDWLDYPRVVGWAVVPLAVGGAIQIRRRASAEVREATVRQAASEERLRMAQDLHDSVGHGLAVIAMQAGVALHVIDRDPAKARQSLEAIRATSREALDGLRGELAILRADDRSGQAAPLRPTPSLRDLDVLLDRVRAGGVRVEVDVTIPEGVSAGVDGAAFRIVQESLTNVLRHSGSDVARVRIGRATEGSGDVLRVAVIDDGSDTAPAAAQGPGSGIAGMRTRATALGGTLTAGPDPAGGFAVRADLPLNHAEGAAS